MDLCTALVRRAGKWSLVLEAGKHLTQGLLLRKDKDMSTAPSFVDLKSLGEPVYRGSVQNLYALPGHPEFLLCETTAGGSVFDVGTIFEIAENDLNRAVFRHAIYTRLAQADTWQRVQSRISADSQMDAAWKAEMLAGPVQTMVTDGARTHHVGMVDAVTGAVATQGLPEHPSCFNMVRRFPVMHPPQRPFLTGHVFDYEQFYQSSTYVVPLEYIVRFGITSGSSILRKYQAMGDTARRGYEQELGLAGEMKPWQMLPQPIFDLTSKYEPEDRNVSRQEALLMSGLGSPQFLATIKQALLGAWVVREALERVGLDLWDLKWEFAVDGTDTFFVDTIDADSFRATKLLERSGHQLIIHYNKQAMRDYYRLVHPEWLAGVNAAKKQAAKEGRPFTQILRAGQAAGTYPLTPEVNADFLALQAAKTAALRHYISGAKTAEAIAAELTVLGEQELDFYAGRGLLAGYSEINAVK
jgi:phosphoribosylaminoimidazole-succinocarboxamide synthase